MRIRVLGILFLTSAALLFTGNAEGHNPVAPTTLPMLLAFNQVRPDSLVVDSEPVHRANYGTDVTTMAKATGQSLQFDATFHDPQRLSHTADITFTPAFTTYLPLILKPTAPPPTFLASGQAHPSDLAVDSQTVYWANCGTYSSVSPDGAIMALSKSQGISQTLASGLSCPTSLTDDTDSLFWLKVQWGVGTGTFALFRMPKSGGPPVELTTYEAIKNYGLAVDETYVYWGENNGVVMKLPKAGGGTPQAAPVPALVFDGPNAYWVNSNDDLLQANKDGSSMVTLVSGSDLAQLGNFEYSVVHIDAIFPKPSGIYFTVNVNNHPGFGSCTDQVTVLMKVPRDGGEYKQVAWAPDSPLTLVTEPFVYFSGFCTRGIRKVNLDTQAVENVVWWPESASALADDTMYVYWADSSNGWIKRVDK